MYTFTIASKSAFLLQSFVAVDTTSRFDCVYWCGDLNFRLEQRREAVEGKVSQMSAVDSIPHFDELLHGDQLSKYITEGKFKITP